MKQKFFEFMMGRYGSDKLNIALLILYIIIAIVNIFFGGIVLMCISFLLFVIIIYRMFSRRIPQRSKENIIFERALNKFTGFFKYHFNKIKNFRKKVYCKCPNCKCTIRLPRKKGKHIVSCPKCHKDFNIKVWF